MLRVRREKLPHQQGDPRCRPDRTEEVLPEGAQAHPAQGITEEVVASCRLSEGRENWPVLSFSGGCQALFAGNGPLKLTTVRRGVAQLVEHRSPKPAVERSSRSAPVSPLRAAHLRSVPEPRP